MLKEKPKEICVCDLEVLLMPNGEILCFGQSMGFFENLAPLLTIKEMTPIETDWPLLTLVDNLLRSVWSSSHKKHPTSRALFAIDFCNSICYAVCTYPPDSIGDFGGASERLWIMQQQPANLERLLISLAIRLRRVQRLLHFLALLATLSFLLLLFQASQTASLMARWWLVCFFFWHSQSWYTASFGAGS